MPVVDGFDYTPIRNDEGTHRVLVAVDIDLDSAPALFEHQMEGRTMGNAAVGHLLATAVAEAVRSANWSPGVTLRGVTATLDGYSASR